ncbi:MAG TPA: hypothetical protein HA224_00840 [Nanoarchaeota archaeon]|nr:hypothetical protein [Nanoarchaeota archaeon]
MATELMTNLDLTALILFLAGWTLLVYRDYVDKTNSADPLAIFFFMIGSLVLAAIQYLKSLPVFILLGVIIAILSIIHWFYIPNRTAKLKKEIVRAERKLLRR